MPPSVRRGGLCPPRGASRLGGGPSSTLACARSLVAGHYQPLADNPGIAPGPDQTRSLQSDQRTLGSLRWGLSGALRGSKLPDPRSAKGWGHFGSQPHAAETNYLISALAPAWTSFFNAASASALGMASLTGFGAPSTRSLASFRPRPVSSRTALMTETLFAPASSSTTLNSVFSSTTAAAAPPPAPAGPAIAAADTPNFSSMALTRSLSSITDMPSRAVRKASLSNAIFGS